MQRKKSVWENKWTACISEQLFTGRSSAGQVLGFSANPQTTPVITTLHKPGKPPSPMPVIYIIQWNNPQMPTEHKNFFNQLDNHLKTLKTNHLIKLLKADPHLKFLFLHYQPLTYPFQSQCIISSQAGIFLKICHNRQFRDGVEALCLYSHSPNNCKTV